MQINGVILFFCSAFLAVNAREIFRLAPRAEPAKTREFPYEVSLQKGGYHHCGGALISRTHVLTAAHCVTQAFTDSFDSYAKFLTVEAGTTNIGQGETYEIKRIAYHKDYDGNLNGPRILPNDIAVITLQRPVTESESVKIISLPPAGYEVPTGESVSIAGWGSEVYTSYTSSFLKKSSFKALSFDECYKYGRESMGRIFEPSQICAKFGYGYGTCGGDSGSPLVHNNFVVGIASSVSGEGCGLGHPDIYTKVSRFIPFIKTEMSLQPGTRNHEYAYALNYDENEATQTSYKPTQAPPAPTQAPTTRATQSPPRIDGVHHGFIFEQGKGVIQY